MRADVSLNSGAGVDVTAGDGGSIAVNARNLDILGGSVLRAGIRQGLGSVGTQAGDVDIDATGSVTLSGSNIFDIVQSGAVGKGGGCQCHYWVALGDQWRFCCLPVPLDGGMQAA